MSDDVGATGAAAIGGGVLQQDGQQLGTALVFVNDYQPGVPLEVVSRLQQPIVNSILGSDEQGEPVVDPTDYNGYIYNYTECGPGNYNLVFLRETALQTGQTYSFATDATFWNNRIQLLEVDVQSGGGQAANGADDGTAADGDDETDTADADGADNATADGDNETADGADNDTVEVTNVTVGNETDGNETG